MKKTSIDRTKEAKLLQEINILKKMVFLILQKDHPHIVKLYEFYSDSNYYYMVTDYVDKGELLEEIQRRKSFTE